MTSQPFSVDIPITMSCDFTVIPCKYVVIGCSEKRTKKRMREHEEDASTHFPCHLSVPIETQQLLKKKFLK